MEVFVASRDDDADYRNAVAQNASLHVVLPEETRFTQKHPDRFAIARLLYGSMKRSRQCMHYKTFGSPPLNEDAWWSTHMPPPELVTFARLHLYFHVP
jgi:hypothetical protein